MKTELQSIGALVNLVKRRSIISLICNVKRSSLILEKVNNVVYIPIDLWSWELEVMLLACKCK
jgi:hypothetical protein